MLQDFLWKYVLAKFEPNPVIIDSGDFCRHPDKVLPKLFKAMGIPFDVKYLSWNGDEEILKTWKGSTGGMEAGRVMKSYNRAFKSSSFVPPWEERNAKPAENSDCLCRKLQSSSKIMRCINTDYILMTNIRCVY